MRDLDIYLKTEVAEMSDDELSDILCGRQNGDIAEGNCLQVSREDILDLVKQKYKRTRHDLLTREQCLEIICESCNYKHELQTISFKEVCQNELKRCKHYKAILNAPANEEYVPPNWICVKDRQPEEYEPVLLVFAGTDKVTIGYHFVTGKGSTFPMDWYDGLAIDTKNPENKYVGAGCVKYWMPLPKAPKDSTERVGR